MRTLSEVCSRIARRNAGGAAPLPQCRGGAGLACGECNFLDDDVADIDKGSYTMHKRPETKRIPTM